MNLIISSWRRDVIIALDTASVGVPAALCAFIFRKRLIIRVGGDFVWESYVNRVKSNVPLSAFYKKVPTGSLSLSEQVTKALTVFVLRVAYRVAFNSKWQADIWTDEYKIDPSKVAIVHNHFERNEKVLMNRNENNKIFIASARQIHLKNMDLILEIFDELQKNGFEVGVDGGRYSHEELILRMQNAYAIIVLSVSDIAPNLILEGLALGKPFVLTRENGLDDNFLKCGIVVDVNNREDIKRGIKLLLDNGVYSDCVSHIKNLTNRTWEQVVSDILALAK